ncbi:MAG: toll/interleukin-1 receptor domain-containing protein, partial [Firmicutes bacterium]|nr:toll/interleukin-1 receptor domain-containing protein [Bacillota bacterium]
LVKHLSPLKIKDKIKIWSGKNIYAGKEWDKEIKKQIASSEIILLLISPNFLISDYCCNTEMKIAIGRHDKDDAIVIPISIRPVLWDGLPFSKLQGLPIGLNAIEKWENKDEAYVNVVQEIEKVVDKLSSG